MTRMLTQEEVDGEAAEAYPTTEAGWTARYEALWRGYVGGKYSPAEVKRWHLYRAMDENNKEIDVAYRVARDFAFLVDTYGPAVAGIFPGPVLEDVDRAGPRRRPTRRASSDTLLAAEAVWRRSSLLEQVGRWSRLGHAMGDGFVEVVRTQGRPPFETKLVWRSAANCRAYYDATGTRIVRGVVEMQIAPGEELPDSAGVNAQPQAVTYRRVLTETEVKVTIDDSPVAEESGEHGLGVVPLAHFQPKPWTEPEHGLAIGHPLDGAVGMIDSVLCMARAMGNRHAAPIIVVKGATLGRNAESKVGRIGKTWHGLPADADVKAVDVSMDGVGRMLEAAAAIWEHVRRTEPAYIFADSAGAESGEAKGYRSAAFEMVCHDIRRRFYGTLLRATAIAVAADGNRAVRDEAEQLVIDGPPVLPRNVGAEVRTYVEIRNDLRPEDRVRFLQRLGLVSAEHDPAEYAEALSDETGDYPAGVGGDGTGTDDEADNEAANGAEA